MNLMIEGHRIHLLGGSFGIQVLVRHPVCKQHSIGLVPFHTGNRSYDFNAGLLLGTMATGTLDRAGCFLLAHQCLVTVHTGIVR
jgi:hypothetical protein